jgi:hypothetical protein
MSFQGGLGFPRLYGNNINDQKLSFEDSWINRPDIFPMQRFLYRLNYCKQRLRAN